MSVLSFCRHPVTLYMFGCVFLLLSTLLLAEHAIAVRQFTTVTFPLAAEIPPLERRQRILEEQVQAAELQEALLGDVERERVRVFVFPSTTDTSHLVRLFDVLREELVQQKLMVDMSEVTIGGAEPLPGTPYLLRIPCSLTLRLRPDGLERVLWLMAHAGAVTVADALSADEVALLLARAEEENSSSIVALEHFLATDLLRYATEPKPFEEQLRRSFVSDGFQQAFDEVRGASLATARTLLGGHLGSLLEAERLWPLRALRMVQVTLETEETVYRLSLDLEAYARAEP